MRLRGNDPIKPSHDDCKTSGRKNRTVGNHPTDSPAAPGFLAHPAVQLGQSSEAVPTTDPEGGTNDLPRRRACPNRVAGVGRRGETRPPHYSRTGLAGGHYSER